MKPTDSTTVAQDRHHVRFRNFFRDLGPGLITGAADDDPSGISTYSVAGATLGYAGLWTALFSFPLMAAVAVDVRTAGNGHRSWTCECHPASLSAMGAVAGLRTSNDCKRIQHRRRPWRYGGCNADGDCHSLVCLDASVRRVDHRTSILDVLPGHREDLQVANVGLVCLFHRRIPSKTRLVAGTQGDFYSPFRMDEIVCFRFGRNPWNYNLSLSFFLAGRAGSRGRPGAWQEVRGATERRNRRRAEQSPERRRDRYAAFKSCDVFHHPNNGDDVARARHYEH